MKLLYPQWCPDLQEQKSCGGPMVPGFLSLFRRAYEPNNSRRERDESPKNRLTVNFLPTQSRAQLHAKSAMLHDTTLKF